MVDIQTFLTTNRRDFKWPSWKPLAMRPVQPPVTTISKNFYVKGPVDLYCHCDGHLYNPQMNRYLKLAKKELMLHEELEDLHKDMANLSGEILEHECDNYDDKMETTYKIDYTKRGSKPTEYIKLMPMVDSPASVPVKSKQIGLGNGYRDPSRFRYSTFPRPSVDPCPPVSFKTTPETVTTWFIPDTGKSEYQDTISKTGLGIIRSSQQHAEPLPSSRRRYGDPCV